MAFCCRVTRRGSTSDGRWRSCVHVSFHSCIVRYGGHSRRWRWSFNVTCISLHSRLGANRCIDWHNDRIPLIDNCISEIKLTCSGWRSYLNNSSDFRASDSVIYSDIARVISLRIIIITELELNCFIVILPPLRLSFSDFGVVYKCRPIDWPEIYQRDRLIKSKTVIGVAYSQPRVVGPYTTKI